MQCREVECIIPSYLKGEETETVTLIDSHLAECKSCREIADLMKNVSKNLANITPLKPEKGFVNRIHNRILKTGPQVVKGPGETTTRLEAVGKSSRRTSLSNRQKHKKANLSFVELIKVYMSKVKTPAFAYAFAVHLVVLGLCIFLYRAESKNINRTIDAPSLRYLAYGNALQQNMKMGKIKVDVLMQNGEVYITKNNYCIQVQLTKPIKGDFEVATIVDGELTLEQSTIDRYFKDSEVTILVFNGAVEVWSKSTFDKYIETEVGVSVEPA